MIRALGYLAWRSTWNRTVRQFRRLRTPRYLVAVILGLLYLAAIVEQQRTARAGAEPGSAAWVEVLAALAVAGASAWAWLFGSERRVLTFAPADVTFLFAGPVTRQDLVRYKLIRAQLVVLVNVLLWTVVLAREQFGAGPWLRALSLWVLLTTLTLHRLGASFTRASLLAHGTTALHRRILPALAAAAGIALFVAALWRLGPGVSAAVRSGGGDGVLSAIAAAAREPPLRWLLLPFTFVVRPLTAPDTDAWVRAMGPAVAILVVHFLWVVRSDAEFEESAIEYTLARARRRASGGRARAVRATLARRPLPRFLHLDPTGWPAGAILWKNLVSVVRLRPTRGIVISGLAAGLLCAMASFRGNTLGAEFIGWITLVWAGLMLVIGPQWIRNDLRADLPTFDLLRSYPVPGHSVIAAEVTGSSLVLTVAQLGLLGLSYLAFLGNADLPLDFRQRTLALLAGLVYLPAINFLGMAIQNGGALLFPTWVRSGPERPGGLEAIGQNMLLIVLHTGALAVLLTLPALLSAGTYLVLQPVVGEWAEIPRAVIALAVVAVEARMMVGWLGRVLERTDPTALGLGT